MNRDTALTGTPVIEPEIGLLRAGPLEAHFDAGALRWVRWKGVEILRALTFLVRTPGWGTPAAKLTGIDIHEDAQGFSVSYRAHYGGPGEGVWAEILLSGKASGTLRVEATVRAEASFETNRTGFVVLYPLDGFAGTEVHVEHASGRSQDLIIPAQISPGQPVKDIRSITHQPHPGLAVATHFEGDVFEMEDHRNWSDASFKVYSRPIELPYPYLLMPEVPVTQSVTVTIADQGTADVVESAVTLPTVDGQCLPEYALPLDKVGDAKAALTWGEAIRSLAPGWLLLRYDLTYEPEDSDLSAIKQILELSGAQLELQVILASVSDDEVRGEIAALAARFDRAGILVGRVGAFAKIDEQSFQPGQVRPSHPSEITIAAALATHFATSKLVGGSPAFFTEFNRKRPDPTLWSGLSFATTPSVHAVDDASVFETLETLPHILASAKALSNDLPLLIGPVGIGARINPYGAAPAVNDPLLREGMAACDPRQRGLFAAAWIVGYFARIVPFAPERFAFGATVGPFGLISTRQEYQRPLWDDLPEGALYPLYHVARHISAAAGASLGDAGTKDGIARITWHREGRRHALIANLTPQSVALPATGFVRPLVSLLDVASIEQFSRDPDASVPREQKLPSELDAYAVLSLSEKG